MNMFKKLWELVNGFKMKTGGVGALISGALMYYNHLQGIMPPEWTTALMSCSTVLTLIGAGHKLIKIEQDSKALLPILSQLKPIIQSAIPVADKIISDAGEPAQPSKPAGFISIKALLGLLIISMLIWAAIPVFADDVSTPENPQVWFQGLGIQGWHILQRTDVDYLRGTTSQNDYVGAKCKFLSWPSDPIDLKYITLPEEFLSLNYGGITSHLGNGDFYGSISITPFQVATNGASFLSYISIGRLSDFRDHSNDEWIIGTSIPLGDMRKAITGLFGLN